MNRYTRERRIRSVVLATVIGCTAPSVQAGTPGASDWPQWGGATRDFHSTSTGLADKWPAEGPRRLWSRPLGEGYSSVVSDGRLLYTMYRDGGDEVIVAMRPESGETAWEHRCPVEPSPDQTAQFGQGPNATPLILDGSLFTVGFTGLVHCLKLDSGEPLWSSDLVKDHGGTIQHYGYANSPIAYNGAVIMPVGGRYGVIAVDPKNGTPLWKSNPYDISYAPPVLINVDGQDQLVFFTLDQVVGIDPKNGSHLWGHQVVNFCKTNCTAAIWGDDNLLWAATKGVGGTRVLKLSQRAGTTDVEEVWLNRKVRIYHWNANRIGNFIYTSIGDTQKFLSVIDVRTGEVVKRLRGFGSTNGIHVNGKLVLLDDGGTLALAKVSEGDIEIVSQTSVSDSVTWTPPTLLGTTLIVRDRKNITALDLGKGLTGSVKKERLQ